MDATSAFACLNRAWHTHRTEIRSFLSRRIADKAETDDLLQDVFLKALLLGRSFCTIDNPRAWLFQVARNMLIDRLRLTREQVPLPDDLIASTESSMDAVDALTQCLPRVLSELTAEDRAAIVLCDLNGVTQQEFAERAGISLPAAKSRVQRARRRLQARMVDACQVRFDEDGKICCFVPRPPLGETPKA